MSVSSALFRLHRAMILVFAGIVVTVEVTVVPIITNFTDLGFSFWLGLAGSAAKYWTLVLGIMLVSGHLKVFVTNGYTRRAFAAGATVFVTIVAAGVAAVVTLGHWLESTVVVALGEAASDYPVLTGGGLPGEFGRVFPVSLAWAVTGALIALGFYRFGGWRGLIAMVPAALPAAVSEGLVAINERGLSADLLPYLIEVLISLTVTVFGLAVFGLLTRGVAIRRTAG
ncbi:hypothetical protein [Paractinoplanes rishiriensis]|uniref:Uncharacterized protein n=1 Tax=Paractinoplanes rishiriensis TaxID=1050105 RepID=A0A919JZA0_9ACTN|nr:hypothetical protein [Actinoplanes rishiriensis]GIE93701.1 hypothetical protein Ari01nite_11660 [Actinoplanes rishiriensis]